MVLGVRFGLAGPRGSPLVYLSSQLVGLLAGRQSSCLVASSWVGTHDWGVALIEGAPLATVSAHSTHRL
jgi:hypothetical protein